MSNQDSINKNQRMNMKPTVNDTEKEPVITSSMNEELDAATIALITASAGGFAGRAISEGRPPAGGSGDSGEGADRCDSFDPTNQSSELEHG